MKHISEILEEKKKKLLKLKEENDESKLLRNTSC